MNFGKNSSNFFRGKNMKNFFSSKYNFKFFDSYSKNANKSFINLSNAYFLMSVQNIINTCRFSNSIEVSKLIIGSTKSQGTASDEASYTELDPLGSIMNNINEFTITAKSKSFIFF